MTDRYAGYIVVLEKDVREDDAQVTIAAIEQIKGVQSVVPYVASAELKIAEERARRNLTERMWDMLR